MTAGTFAELQTAITNANVNPDLDTITLTANIVLTADLPGITHDISVVGAGFTIDGAGNTAFQTTPGVAATFTDLNISDAQPAIYFVGSNLTLTDSTFDNATVTVDASAATIEIRNSTFDSVVGDDGLGISVDAASTVTIEDCSASSNQGAGIHIEALDSGTTVSVTRTTALSNLVGFDLEIYYNSVLDANDLTASENLDQGMWLRQFNGGTTADVADSTFSDNLGEGIALELDGDNTTTFDHVAVTGNTGLFGGIHIFDDDSDVGFNTVTIYDSLVTDNVGTGIYASPLFAVGLKVERSTIADNTFEGKQSGGGIYVEMDSSADWFEIVNSTITGNEGTSGGGLWVWASSTEENAPYAIVSHTTIARNISTNEEGNSGGLTLTLQNFLVDHTISAANTSNGSPLDFSVSDPGEYPTDRTVNHSLIQEADSGIALGLVDAGIGNIKNVDAKLGPLADHGGLTPHSCSLAAAPQSTRETPE